MYSVCIRRPAESSGYCRLRASATRSGGKLVEDFVLLFLRQAFENVDGIVQIEFAHALGDGFGRQLIENFFAHRMVDFGQRGKIEIVPQQRDQLGPLVRVERFEQVAEIGLMQFADEPAQRLRIGRFDRTANALDEFAADRSLFVAERKIGGGSACRSSGSWLEHRFLPNERRACRLCGMGRPVQTMSDRIMTECDLGLAPDRCCLAATSASALCGVRRDPAAGNGVFYVRTATGCRRIVMRAGHAHRIFNVCAL